MHPGQHLNVLNVMFYSKQVGKATIEASQGLVTQDLCFDSKSDFLDYRLVIVPLQLSVTSRQ